MNGTTHKGTTKVSHAYFESKKVPSKIRCPGNLHIAFSISDQWVQWVYFNFS